MKLQRSSKAITVMCKDLPRCCNLGFMRLPTMERFAVSPEIPEAYQVAQRPREDTHTAL